MNHSHTKKTNNNGYKLSEFLPLIIILGCIVLATILAQWYRGFSLHSAMSDFMGFFFLIFGAFKILNWPAFVQAYKMYDLLAQRSTIYAYAYPLIELSLGAAYLLKWNLFITNIVTVIVMTISALGVARELAAGRKIMCACLGAVFKIPMTWVTLTEDILMAAMALIMLVYP